MKGYTARVHRHEWTREQENFIMNNYGPMTSTELAKVIGVTPAAVMSRIRKLTDERKKK